MTDANRPGEGEPTPGATPSSSEPLPTAAPAPPAGQPAPAPPAEVAASPAQPPSYPPPPSPQAEVPPPPAAAPAPMPVVPPAAPAPVRRRTWPGRLGRIIAFLFGVLQALLFLRIILLLLVANPDNEIVSAILTITDPFVEPFRGMFQLDEVTGQRGSVLDIAAVVAFIAWSLIETLILTVLRLFNRPQARA